MWLAGARPALSLSVPLELSVFLFFLELSLELSFSSSLISLSLARYAGRTPGPGGRPTTKSISTPPASVASSDGDRPSREELSSDLFGDSSCIPRTPLPHRSDQICENGVQKDCGGTNMLENILRNLQSVPGKR